MARETIAGLYEGDRLAAALQDARRRTLGIYSHLDLAKATVPCIAIVNPPVWELSHIAWFQEYWCLRYDRDAERVVKPPLLPAADDLFDSRSVAHDLRWTLPYPPLETLRAYMADTLDATLAALAATPEDQRYFFRLALLHEDMHGEALLMTLQTMGWPLPPLGAQSPPTASGRITRDVRFSGGEFEQGATGRERAFVFDNEKWAHTVQVAPFAMAESPVTQREYAQFVDDGGYAQTQFWTAEGWRWRESMRLEAPRHWCLEGSRWLARHFSHWAPIDPTAPMMQVSLHEAHAFCRWARRRLPTEAEWEFAARNGGRDDRYPWGDDPHPGGCLDFRFSGPSAAVMDPGYSASGLRQMIGGVWEWTSTPFSPYPGFQPDPYREYSEPWFHSHHVLRGGSFATRARLVHNRFRNFYLPDRTDVFAGFRTCALDAP
ncbi:MAG TPA: selenoneine synthase SenA [Usitatibacter sp.]|nr:selenoneine synthase SenA [Usitatibacter sp.]